MNWITDLFNQLSRIFQWWVIVLPWERGLRIRLGRHQKVLTPGTYLKLPIIDNVFIQSIRLRYISVPIQTVTTRDGKTITITGSVGYAIRDVAKLYNTIYSPNSTIANIVMGEISKFCAINNIENCLPDQIEVSCTDRLKANDYGLGDVSVKIIGYAVVKTFRLIQDHSWFPENENALVSTSGK